MSSSTRRARFRRPRSPVILGAALALATAVTALVPAAGFAGTTPPPAGKVVISEFRTRGPAGGNDEFVELRNVGAAPVDIGGYKLQGCSSTSGTPSDRATVTAGTTLAPGQAYLLTNSGSATRARRPVTRPTPLASPTSCPPTRVASGSSTR